jgi:hypothetical protein
MSAGPLHRDSRQRLGPREFLILETERMTQERLTLRKIRDILRLKEEVGLSALKA